MVHEFDPERELDSSATAELNAIFTLLSDPDRRLVLYYLLAGDRTVATFDELLGVLSARSRGTHSAYDRSVRLKHTVLPGLEEAGLVDIDDRTRTIRYNQCDLVSAWLARAADVELRS